MKTSTFKILISLLFFLSGLQIAAQDTCMNVTFTGSAGYILETPNKKVAIDAIFGNIVNTFDAGYPAQAVLDSIELAADPYDSIDLFLVSHEHQGHFDAELLVKCFELNSDAYMITTQGAKDALEALAEDWASMEPRIFVPGIEVHESMDTSFNGIQIEMTRIGHSTPTGLFCFYVKVEGISVAYYIGFSPSYEEYHCRRDSIDIGLLQGDWVSNADTYAVTDSLYDIGFISMTHLNTFATVRPELLNYLETENLDNVNFMYMAMEEMKFTKSMGVLHVDTINLGPEQQIALADLDPIAPGETLDYSLPVNAFTDPDQDELRYSFIRGNGDPLPDWITVDEGSLNFSGTPTEAKNVGVVVYVKDKNGAFLSDDFIIFVQDPELSQVHNGKSLIEVYPNPGTELINLKLAESLTATAECISLYTHSGQKIFEEEVSANQDITLDISGFKSGNYILCISTSDEIYTRKITRL